MSQLKFTEYSMPSANLGELNCLADISSNSYIHANISVTDAITVEESQNIGKGMIQTLLPYQIQDGYDRSRSIKNFKAAILENDYLKATFIPELGGRLWSLYDKKQDKELLYCNNVFQPGNLGLRNAWFSGGVEWNVGIKGHNPLTCAPLFAQECVNSYGDPVLKMYEFERIREIVYTLYATLKNDILLIKVVIENTKSEDSYMYWWSNIAVDETPDTRVIVPCSEAFVCDYNQGSYVLDSAKIPHINGSDISYSVNLKRSRDFFFKIPEENNKWVAAIDKCGKGLAQFSDHTLIGRKMFLWGQHSGGKHWNEWLSDTKKPYIEIQAGLLKTQLEHFIMKANSKISWTEGYTCISGDIKLLHDKDFSFASKEAEKHITPKLETLEQDYFIIIEEKEIKYFGSGWGAIEILKRKEEISKISSFPQESITEEQSDWLTLLIEGTIPNHSIEEPVKSYVKGDFWISLLENNPCDNWYYYYQLGITYYSNGEKEKSFECFKKSNSKEANPWALRNMAQLEKMLNSDKIKAAEYMLEAIKLKPDYLPLLIECATSLIDVNRYNDWISIYNSLTEDLQNNGRLKFLLSVCYIRLKDTENTKKLLNSSLVVCDIKEGEYALSDIWCELYRQILAKELNCDECQITKEEVFEKYPLPFELDFRMN